MSLKFILLKVFSHLPGDIMLIAFENIVHKMFPIVSNPQKVWMVIIQL